jgi:hypothetical protein
MKMKRRVFAAIMIAVFLLSALTAKSGASPAGLQTFILPGGSLTTANYDAWGGVSGWVSPYGFDVDRMGVGSVGLRMYVYGLDMSKILYEGGWVWPPNPKDLGAIADAGIAGDTTVQFDMKNAAWFQLHSSCGAAAGTWNIQGGKFNHTTGVRKWLVQGWSRGIMGDKVFPDDPTHQYNVERFVPNTPDWGSTYMPGYKLPYSEYQTFDFKIEYIALGAGQYKMQGWIRMHAAASWDEMWYLNWPYKWQWNTAINNVADPESAWVKIGGHQPDGGERIVTNVDLSEVYPFITIGNWGTTQTNKHTISWSSVRVEGIRAVPEAIKQNVLDDLTALGATVSDKEDGKKLDEAIKHLTKSLNPELWTDETHLQAKHGEKVFNEEKDAVVKLLELIKDKKSAFYQSTTLLGFIDRLVSADRLLASTAIDEAVTAGGDAKKIDKANDELGKGDARVADGHFTDAIEHYRNAWKHAVNAV